MKKTNGLLVVLFVFSLALSSLAGHCPYTGVQLDTPYSSVNVLPVQKYVGEDFVVTVTDVDEDGVASKPQDRLIIVYQIDGEEVVSEYNIYTNVEGKASFSPEDSGEYALATSGRYVFFEVLSRCGDGLCTSGENRANCPKDCATCGDGVCDTDEDKENCAKDCVVCGDGVCDQGENRASCPADCATCGDFVCDVNENKINCPEDCVVCGDGVCDSQEILSLHNTTCPKDCVVCGDGVCDSGEEEDCATDCAECGNDICELSENETCPSDCAVCGNEVCEEGENREKCMVDCAVCGDGYCDSPELEGLHKSNCPKDCAVCGDGYCDKGEGKDCEEDCKEDAAGFFLGYFALPLILAILLVVFELFRFRSKEKVEALSEEEKAISTGQSMDLAKFLPYFSFFAISLFISTLFLMGLGLSYEKNLAVFDLGDFLITNAFFISIMAIVFSMGTGVLARASYYLKKKDATIFVSVSAFLAMIPTLLIYLNLEYFFLLLGAVFGSAIAMHMTKGEEEARTKKEAFKAGSSFSERLFMVIAIFAALAVFLGTYMHEDLTGTLSESIWQSDATRKLVQDNFNRVDTLGELEENVVAPFIYSESAGISGRLMISFSLFLSIAVIAKLFSIVIRYLSGLFSWMLDKVL